MCGAGIRNAALAYLVTGEENYLKNTVALAETIARKHKMDTYATPEALFGWRWPMTVLRGIDGGAADGDAQAMLRHGGATATEDLAHSDFNNHFLLERCGPSPIPG